MNHRISYHWIIIFCGLLYLSLQSCAKQSLETSSDSQESEIDNPIFDDDDTEEITHPDPNLIDPINSTACTNWRPSFMKDLDQLYQINDVRIIYTLNLNSPHKIEDLTDINNNGYPDYVENAALQLITSRKAFNSLGFLDPLQSQRYKKTAQFIDVLLVDMRVTDGGDYNGLAYEEPAISDNNSIKGSSCSLNIKVSNHLKNFPEDPVERTYWSVITHELFHLYQYGTFMFKQGWLNEATSAWAERVIRLGSTRLGGQTPLPTTQTDLDIKVFSENYNVFFDRLAYLHGISIGSTVGTLKLSSEILNTKYINGVKVFKDERLLGVEFMVLLFKNLQNESDRYSKEQGLSLVNWAESEQRSVTHRSRLIKIIQQTIIQMKMENSGQEINQFLTL